MSMLQNPVTLLTLLLLVVNTAVAVGAYIRVGRWRDSDDGKKVKEDISDLKSEIKTGEGSTIKSDIHKLKNDQMKTEGRLAALEKASDRLESDVKQIGSEVTTIGADMKHVAGRADIEALKSDLAALNRSIGGAEAGVQRIENFLMEASRNAA